MRRTADSLLILADAPSRAAGSFSLTVGEALQAATSGVQDYQRVQILSHLGTRISDDAAPDVVHLLTELVDNALNFSPPSEPVRLAAKLGANGVTITVTDAGLGVPTAELDLLNRDLAHGAEATPDTARRMGLFVVSRLAERHGVVASLAKNPGGGMTATILLPPAILPELAQSGAPAAAPAVGKTSTQSSSTPAPAVAAPAALAQDDSSNAEPTKRRGLGLSLGRGRSGKAADKADKAAEKPAAAEAKASDKVAHNDTPTGEPEPHVAAPVAGAAAAVAVVTPSSEPTPDRPSLESLLPRREPGANIPRTGADAFEPSTSGESGPLFGKRTPAATEDGAATPVDQPAEGGEASEPTESSDSGPVASVVSITALASRQRAQAEEARASEELAQAEAEAENTSEEPAAEPVAEAEDTVEAPVAATRPDPLTDPLTVEDYDDAPAEDEQVAEPEVEPEAEAEVAAEPEPEPEAEPEADEPVAESDDVPVDLNDPLGLDGPTASADVTSEPEVARTAQLETTEVETAEVEPEAETPAPAAAVAAPAAYTNGALTNGALTNGALAGGLPTRTRGAADEINRDMPGLPPTNGEPSRINGDSPIFKSMRSGWLAGDEGEFHETEVDRGWEIAEHVAEEAPVAQSTPIGLPRRAPGERLIPGSVTPPEPAKTRDPEAIRRRLQAHTAGVSRGRRAAQSSPQHTEAGPV